jgi:hypothetical protein
MKMQEIIELMKSVLSPQGTEDFVRLFLKRSTYLDKSFVDRAIKEFELSLIRYHIEEPSALEKLGIMVLLDSSYIDLKKDLD